MRLKTLCNDYRPIGRHQDQKRFEVRPLARLVGAMALLAAWCWPATIASAATFTVTQLGDNGAGSLREAIASANAAPGGDTVEFAAALTGTIFLNSPIPINGPDGLLVLGDDRIEIDAQSQSRLFTIELDDGAVARNVVLSKLVLRNGYSNGGGAVLLSGINAKLILQETNIFDSAAVIGSEARGGAVLARFGSGVTVNSSRLEGNRASQHGGGIAMERPQFSAPADSLQIIDCIFRNNSALTGLGGAIYFDSRSTGSSFPASDFPRVREFTVERTRFTANSAGLGRLATGAIDRTTVLSHTSSGSAIYFRSQSYYAQNVGGAPGGADNSSTIGRGGHKISINRVTVDRNEASNGSAVFLETNIPSDEFPAIRIANSTVSQNVFGITPHVVDSQAPFNDPYAHIGDFFDGVVVLKTFGPADAYDSNDPVNPEQNRVQLEHVTITENYAPHSPGLNQPEGFRLAAGLAVLNLTPETDLIGEDFTIDGPLRVRLYNSVVSNNRAFTGTNPFDAGSWQPGVSYWPGNEVRLESVGSYIATQMTGDLDNNINLSCCDDREFPNPVITIGSIVGDDPDLEPLADNGGPPIALTTERLPTHNPFYDTATPANSSPLIDAANSTVCLGDDQRQRVRPVDLAGAGVDGPGPGTCDIGAVETSNDRPMIRVYPLSDPMDVFDNGQTSILAGKTLFGPVLQGDPAPTLSFGIRNFNFQGGGGFSILDVDSIGEVGNPTPTIFSVINAPAIPFSLAHSQTTTFDIQCDSSLPPGIYNRTLVITSDSVPINGSLFPPLDYFFFNVRCVIETPVSDIFVRNANSFVEIDDGSTADFASVNFGPGQNVSQPSPPTLSFQILNLAAPSVVDTLDVQPVTTNSSVITVTSQIPNPTNLNPGQTALFGLSCDNSVAGSYQATVTINSDTELNPSENPYTFLVFCTIDPPPPVPALSVTHGAQIPLPDAATINLGGTTPAVALNDQVIFANSGDDFSQFSIAGLSVVGDPQINVTPMPPLAPIATVYKDPNVNLTWNLLIQCASGSPGAFSALVEVQLRGLASNIITRTFTVQCAVEAIPTMALVPIVNQVPEGSTLTYDVELSAPVGVSIPLDFTVFGVGLNPAAPDDFVSGYPVGTVVIPAGQTSLPLSGLIDLFTQNDVLEEVTEELVVEIAFADPSSQGVVSLVDDIESGFIDDVEIAEIPTLGAYGAGALLLLLAAAAMWKLRTN